MARTTRNKNNFSSGELTPLLMARDDSDAYRNGAKILEGYIPLIQGGIQRAPGREFIAETKVSATASRLLPFVFSTIQAYTLEFGATYIRFYRDGAPIVEGDKTISNVAQGTTTTITATSHGYIDGEHIELSDISGMVHMNGRRVVVTNATTHTFDAYDLNGTSIDSTNFDAYISGGTANRVYTLTSPYAASDVADLQFTQSADTMFIVHPSYKPRELTRTGHTSWTIGNYAPTADPFTSTDNYPAAVAIYEQRLWFAGTNTDPQKFWATVSGNYDDMTTGANASDALVYVIGSNQVNAIRWLLASEVLFAGTDSGPFVVRSSGFDDPITPTNVQIKRHNGVGSDNEPAVLVDELPVFIHRLQKRVYGLTVPDGGDKFRARNLTNRAPHITGSGVTQLAYQQYPYNTLWMARADGQLVGLTMEFDEQVLAWHRHPQRTGDVVESVCVTPSSTGDEVWMIVNRTVGATTDRFVELMKDYISTLVDHFSVECGLSYDGTSTDSIGGLYHLIGETVQIIADGAAHADAIVAFNGSVALTTTASKVHIGFTYESTAEPMPFETGASDGPGHGKPGRVHRLDVRLYESLGLTIGDGTTQDIVAFRETGDAMDSPPPLFTGVKHQTLTGGWSEDRPAVVKQSQALPQTILSVTMQGNINDR